MELLEEQINLDSLWDNKDNATALLKKHSEYKNTYNLYSTIYSDFNNLKDIYALAKEENDSLILQDCLTNLQDLFKLVNQEEIKQLFTDEEDKNDCYLEIHAGAGGVDAQDFASILLRMYVRWCEKRKYSVTILDESRGDVAGIKSTTLKIEGLYSYGFLKTEAGIHRLVRMSPFNADGKRHTSFAGVHVYFDLSEGISIDIQDKDLKIDTYRSSGAGGQHVNTTDSAIRITHIPSNIVVTCQNDRSQHRNRQMAMDLLKSKLFNLELSKKQADKQNIYSGKKAIDFGSQIRSYVLHPYNLVKDHRSNFESSSTKDVLDGDIDDFIMAVLSQT